MTKKRKREGKVVHLLTEYHEKLRRYAVEHDIPMATIIYELIDERIAADKKFEAKQRELMAPPKATPVPVEKKPKPVGIDAIAHHPDGVPSTESIAKVDPAAEPPFWKTKESAAI